MAESEMVAVIGATGQQGGAVVDALLEDGARVRAVVRDPGAAAARALAGRGVELATGDQEDVTALAEALRGAASAFLVTTFGGADATEGEVRRGVNAGEAAVRAGLPRMVYSSVGGAERSTGIPHFESKWRVEQRLRELLPTTVVRPVYFMENLARSIPDAPEGEFVLRQPLPGDVPLQMIAVRDIGRVAASALLDPDLIPGGAVEIAGDELTGDETAREIGEHLGVAARYEALPVDVLPSDDVKAMFRWFDQVPAYRADLAETRRIDPGVLDLRAWLRTR